MSGSPNEPAPRPWGAPAPEPSPYAPPPMPFGSAQGRPDALGVPPPPPPPVAPGYGAPPFDGAQGRPQYPAAPAYGQPPQYPVTAGYPQPGYGVPPPPPPPPPGMGMPDFGVPRPQSGKATASLICAGVGLVGGVICWLPALAIPVGLVLGFMGITETGPTGTRSGRGIAITGTILNAVLLVGGVLAVVAFVSLAARGAHQRDEAFAQQTDSDLNKIRMRLRQYYDANNNSLAPGGPRLAQSRNTAYYGNVAPVNPKGKVTELLKLEDLVGDNELSMPLSMFELTITSSSSATVRANSWNRQQSRVMKIFDIGINADGQFTITDE